MKKRRQIEKEKREKQQESLNKTIFYFRFGYFNLLLIN